MATQRETGNLSPNDWSGFDSVSWKGQKFHVGATGHTITAIKLRFRHDSGTPGTITVSIRSVLTGSDLTSGTINGTGLPSDSTPQIDLSEINLDPNTDYYICVRAQSGGCAWYMNYPSGGTGFVSSSDAGASWDSGNINSFGFYFEVWGNDLPPPTEPPVVQTDAVDNITDVGGRLNGEITDIGLENADYVGFVFDTASHGYPGDIAPASSEYSDYVTVPGDFGVTSFNNTRSDLDPATTYYVRACAHNSDGWAYGDEVSFATEATPPWRFENIAGVTYDETDKKTIFAERLNEILDRLHDLDGLDPT